jgi:ceramide glucosyltransferase
MWTYYFFAAIVIWLGILSLLNGFRFLSYVRREVQKPLGSFSPRLSVIAPCCGIDQGLKENLTALLQQQYAAFEIIFVTEKADDPAIDLISELIDKFSELTHVKTRIVIAGSAFECGQKVHNLRVAVSNTDPLSEAFVFVDSDARPSPVWLRSLVAPLQDHTVGAATGYRWFIPERGGIASKMRSVWNASIASALGERSEKNFCWGGSTAILRATFERLNIIERWSGALSDDFAMTRALQEAKLPIYFVPACLTASVEDCGMRELLEFTTRQLKITRVYAPNLWKAALIGSILFVSVFFGGIVLALVRALMGLPFGIALGFVAVIFVLGAWKAILRLRAVRLAVVGYEAHVNKAAFSQLTYWPFASVLYLFNAICAAFSRRIHWRGITYELKSPTETVIMRSEMVNSK